MKTIDMENIIILGSGPAGCTAAIYAARAGLNPLVVEGLQRGGQLTQTTDIENFPGFPEPIGGMELVEAMRNQALRVGARFTPGTVLRCELAGNVKRLWLDDGAELSCRVVIVATGAAARWLGLPSEKKLMGRGVSACATCDGAFYQNEKVVVVGGGDTAAEDALFLARIASHVTLVHRRDALRASQVMARRVQENPKITMRWNSVVEEVLGENAVAGVRLRDVKTGVVSDVEATGVFVAIGHAPNTDVFKGLLELDADGYIVAERCHTSVEGVFAAGDVQDRRYRQAVTAAGTGCMAALEALKFLEMA
jgi:thioredoxin reductase (NADPH)